MRTRPQYATRGWRWRCIANTLARAHALSPRGTRSKCYDCYNHLEICHTYNPAGYNYSLSNLHYNTQRCPAQLATTTCWARACLLQPELPWS
jgi:hypothetical protein